MNRTARPTSADELAVLLQSRPGRVRLCGTGSRRDRLPPAADALLVDMRGIATIDRLDAQDLTCSVDAGVERAALDRELHTRGVELACAGDGTVGGLFAADPVGAVAYGGGSPRTLLLGLDAVLADGTRWKSGARVVKSVAGFDVHRLLVGSEGRLFAATRLHLRLRPLPRATVWFCNRGLDVATAHSLFTTLRNLALPPAALHWSRGPDGHAIAGRIAGRAPHVAATLRAHSLRESAPFQDLHLEPPAGGEVLNGIVLPSRVPALLARAPADAPFVLHGGGRFELSLAAPAATDALLAIAEAIPCQAVVVRGEPARRGRGTPIDPGARRLAETLKHALDPDGVFV